MNNEYGLDAVLSHESDASLVTGDNFDVVASIEEDNAWDEIVSIEHEAKMLSSATDRFVLARESMDDQVEQMDAMLAGDSAKITPSVVAQAQMGLSATAAMVGTTMGPTVSQEVAASDPVAALELSREGAKETAEKLYKAVKLAIKKLMNMAKKLQAKVMVAVDGTAKKAKALKKAMNKSDLKTPKQAKLKEDDSYRHRKMMAGLNHIGDQSSTAVGARVKSAVTMLEIMRKKALVEEEAKKFDIIGFKNKTTLPIAEDDFFKDLVEDSEDDEIVFPLYGAGSKVKTLVVNVPEVDDKEDAQEILAKTKMYARTFTVEVEKDDDVKVEVLSKENLLILCDALYTSAKGMSKIAKSTYKAMEKQQKETDKLAKDLDISKFMFRLRGNMMNNTRAVMSGVMLSSIVDGLRQNKNELSVLKMHWDYYLDAADI